MIHPRYLPLFLITAVFSNGSLIAQPVTGVWRGKVTRGTGFSRQTYKLEVKLVKKGDSLTGTSYYYASSNNYFRYSVKGVFGTIDNSISWWDDQLIENRTPNLKSGNANQLPLLSTADFNCPGGDVMKMDGATHPRNGGANYEIHLQKFDKPDFADEWDPVIENYFYGGADPDLIDSVGRIAFNKPVPPEPPEVTALPPTTPAKQSEVVASQPVPTPPKPVVIPEEKPVAIIPVPDPVPAKTVVIPEPVIAKAPPTLEEKFAQRRNILTTAIPVSGDSIEFKFYDNAEVDGDSISIFLNGKLLYSHIRLTDKGYSIKIATASLQADNELVMLAENLGSIPPNTAYMEAWSGGKRYSARLESTEQSSAMIKLKKE